MGTSIKAPLGQFPASTHGVQMQLAPFIEHFQIGVLILDGSNGKIIEANSPALSQLGYSKTELISHHIWEIPSFITFIPSSQVFEELREQKSLHFEKLSIGTINDGTRTVELFIDFYKEGDTSVGICQLKDSPEKIGIEETQRRQIESKEMQIRDQKKELDRLQEQIEKEIYERQRLAQDLHDAINQPLFSAGLIAEVLPRLWDRDQTAARRSLEDLRRLTFGAMAEMRVLLAESRPALLADSELADLLMLLGNVLAGRLNIPVSFQAKGKGPISPEAQVALYHLCKEILNIITLRAKTHKVTIELFKESSKTEIHIHGEQDTFEIPGATSNHYNDFQSALKNAEACGANLKIKPAKDGSFEVVLQWKRRLL